MDWTSRKAGDVMTPDPTAIPAGYTLHETITRLHDDRISGAPVIGADGQPVGVVSLHDIIGFVADLDLSYGRLGGYYAFDFAGQDEDWEPHHEVGDRDVLSETAVEAAMTAEVISVEPTATLPEVVATMREHRIHRVLVTDRSGLCGVISSMDVLAVLNGER